MITIPRSSFDVGTYPLSVKFVGWEESAGIYSIEHPDDPRVYVGSSAYLARRIRQHRYLLSEGRHINKSLQASYSSLQNKGQGEAFTFTVIELRSDRLQEVERQYIANYGKQGKLLHNRQMAALVTDSTNTSVWLNRKEIAAMIHCTDSRLRHYCNAPGAREYLEGVDGKGKGDRYPFSAVEKLRQAIMMPPVMFRSQIGFNATELSDEELHGMESRAGVVLDIGKDNLRLIQEVRRLRKLLSIAD